MDCDAKPSVSVPSGSRFFAHVLTPADFGKHAKQFISTIKVKIFLRYMDW